MKDNYNKNSDSFAYTQTLYLYSVYEYKTRETMLNFIYVPAFHRGRQKEARQTP